MVIAVFLAIEMASLLVGEGALPEQESAIRDALEASPDVERVIHLRTLHTRPDELLVGVKTEHDVAPALMKLLIISSVLMAVVM